MHLFFQNLPPHTTLPAEDIHPFVTWLLKAAWTQGGQCYRLVWTAVFKNVSTVWQVMKMAAMMSVKTVVKTANARLHTPSLTFRHPCLSVVNGCSVEFLLAGPAVYLNELGWHKPRQLFCFCLKMKILLKLSHVHMTHRGTFSVMLLTEFLEQIF